MQLTFFSIFGLVATAAAAAQETPANVVLILTDDQDIHMQSLAHMPLLKEHVTDHGTLFRRHFCTVSICCPSRISLLTGKLSHNTNVTDVVPPYGGYPKFVQEGLNENYLPVWLQQAGYNAYYAGKLMNAHTVVNYNSPQPGGWTSADFLLDPYTYNYYNATFQRDAEPPVSWEGSYSTDVLTNKTLNYLQEAYDAGKPFFLGVAPIAPHSEVFVDQSSYELADPFNADAELVKQQILMPQAAERHQNLFNDLIIPRTPDFNPEQPHGVSWVARLPRLNQTSLDYNDEYFRQRLRSMQSVDEMVGDVVEKLESLGILNNTYIIYTTDNGYHIGQHRLQPGKQCGFETDINIPFVVRGPGVPAGKITDVVTSHTDVVPSIFDMMNIPLRSEFDGRPIPLTAEDMERAVSEKREYTGIEFWGPWVDESFASALNTGNTYKGVRLHSSAYDIYYAVHCTNEHELYDMTVDPYQTNNLLPSGLNGTGIPITKYLNSTTRIVGRPVFDVVSRLDALMMVLKSCKAESCTNPWGVIHPQGNVKNLEDALDAQYDDFYLHSAAENAVSFSECENGYIVSAEGLQDPFVFQNEYLNAWS